jgi:hypothetical protein
MHLLVLLTFLTSIFAPLQALAEGSASAYPTGPKTVNVGQDFNVVINASNAKDVDTIRMNGSFTQDLLEYRSAKPTGVFQNVSPGTYVDQPNGIFSFGAFTLSSHANGVAPLAVLTFRAKKPGKAYIQLTTTSRLLSAGEDQLGSVGRLNITIGETVVPSQPQPIPAEEVPDKLVISLRSTTHPDPELWYTASTVAADWVVLGKIVKKTYIGFNESPEGRAETPVYNTTGTTFTAPTDGVWYVHLGVDLKDNTHETADLRVQIDRTDPRPIAPNVDQTLVPASIPNMLRYGTVDDASGIARYEVYIDNKLVTSTLSTEYKLVNQSVGRHQVLVKAFDRAENSVSGKTEFEVVAPPKTVSVKPPSVLWLWLILLAVVVTLLVVNYWIFGKRKTKKRIVRRK